VRFHVRRSPTVGLGLDSSKDGNGGTCGVLVDDPTFHDKRDAPYSGNVLSRVIVKRDDVRLQPGCESLFNLAL
jgi:hypothetical protein